MWQQAKIILKACRSTRRQAFSLLEVTAVIALIGIVSLACITRFGHGSLANGGAEGFARLLQLDMQQARQRTIATGDNHYLQLISAGGSVTSYSLWRDSAGGDVLVEPAREVPQGVTVTASHAKLEFDFEGAAQAAYSVAVAGPQRSWSISVTMLTGATQLSDTTP